MQKLITTTLLMTLITAANISYAEQKKFPAGCRNLGFKFNLSSIDLINVPNGQEQNLYLIHNTSNSDIKMQLANPSRYKPTYEKIIPADSWVAFAKDSTNIQLICKDAPHQETMHEHSDENSYDLDCKEVIELCNYNNAKFPQQSLGTYWLEKSGPQRGMMHEAIQKGILLRS